ncbi:MAG: Nramp family divalent metal transporter [Armatimonadota bacterium]
MLNPWKFLSKNNHRPRLGGLEILKYIGPGLLVTVGFIDPGNWAANIAAGSGFGYGLLWMVTLSTIMLVILQHNVAHLGIATGLCLAEAANKFLHPWIGKALLGSAMLAAISTALAEILGGAIGLRMLFRIPLQLGVVMVTVFVLLMLLTNSYRRIERWIIAFVSLIGLSFLFELHLVGINWGQATTGWVVPWMSAASIPIVMSVLGAVVMPHNLFLHSEIIQSRQWNLEDDATIKRQLNFEFLDTLFSMVIGWAINSAMILVATATFFAHQVPVDTIEVAKEMLTPLLGKEGIIASLVFALALLFAGAASSITAGMAGGSIFAGFYNEPYDPKDRHTHVGIAVTIIVAAVIIFFIGDPFKGLIVSQILLSIQLPWTIFTQISLTSSPKVMGKYVNGRFLTVTLWAVAAIVSGLNLALLWSFLPGH